MIVREVIGKSFKGLSAYLLHDKNGESAERVAWTHTANVNTDDPQAAIRHMQYTSLRQKDLREAADLNRGKESKKLVLHYVLSWEDGHEPEQRHMIKAGQDLLARLDLQDHEALFVAHNDTGHAHLHIVVNKIHPDTGAANKLKFSKEKQQQWALDYERQQGEILCRQREAHDAQRQAEAQRRQEARDQGQDPGKAQYARYDDHENYWDREAYEAEFQKAVVDAAIEQEEQRQAQEARAQAEARRQAERSAAETRLNRRLAALQSAHFDARQALDERLARQQHATREAVENQYRFSIRQNQATIADLEAKLDQGGLSGWLYRLQHGEDARERLEAARQSLGNAEMRQAEARQALDRQAEAERQQLLQTQARERAALEQELSLLRARQAARDRQQETPSAQRRAEASPAFNQQAANQNVPPAPQQEVRPAFNQQAAANQNDPPGQQETVQPDRQQGVQGGHGPQKNLER